MKKLFVTASALVLSLGIGFAILTTTNTANAEQPGQVGNAPRCDVSTERARDNSFVVNGDKARVQFKATGPENCRVRVSTNSFYAPTMNGKPYDKQILFNRETKVVGRGTHSLPVDVPVKSTPSKGCFYQLDLTYGTHNITPVLAYAHGAIKDCGQPKPEASCENLNVAKLSRNNFRFTAKADTKHGANIRAYVFTVTKGGKKIATKTIQSDAKKVSYVYGQTTAGTYNVQVTVRTSEGEKTAADCKGKFTVTPVTPGTIEVCEIATGKIVEIKQNQMSDKYTTDLSKCNVTPETPDTPTTTTSTPQTPKALPVTGPGAVAAIFTGVTSLTGLAHYFFTRRFGL